MELEFSRQIFEKNIGMSILVKIRPVGAESFQADGRDRHPDMTNLTVAYHNFANAHKNRTKPGNLPKMQCCFGQGR